MERKRATDPIWSLTVHEIKEERIPSDRDGNYLPSQGPILYTLTNDVFDNSKAPPLRRFVAQELMVIPYDTDDIKFA